MVITLPIETRDRRTKPEALRRQRKIPAVYYGHSHPSIAVAVGENDFLHVWRQAGESMVVTLKTPTGDVESLIHTVDRHPVSGKVLHVDFYVFEKGQKIRVKIPIQFVGMAPAVKEQGGVLVKVLRELEVEAAPKDLPNVITIELSPLVDFQSVLLAKKVSLPPGVTLLTNPEEVVASVYEPKEEAVPEAPIDISQIEVEKKGKVVTEGEEISKEKTTPIAEAPSAKETKGKG